MKKIFLLFIAIHALACGMANAQVVKKSGEFRCGGWNDDFRQLRDLHWDMEELDLRVEALLRRCRIVNARSMMIGDTKLDFETLTVQSGSQIIELRKKEFQLLEKLLSTPMKIFTRQALMDDIWGYDSESALRTVDAHVKRLRAKLVDVDDFEIETIRGLGYKAVIRK